MNDVLMMAGYFSGHALWSVSDDDGLVPMLGYQTRAGGKTMTRLSMDASSAMSLGQSKMSELSDDVSGGVFIYDGLIGSEDSKVDALLIDVHFAGESARSLHVALPYRLASHNKGFAIHPLVFLDSNGFEDGELEPMAPIFFEGIESHEEAKRLLSDKFEETIEHDIVLG